MEIIIKYYVDSCIWRDYYENREDNLRPLGEFAFQFFQYCNKNRHRVLTSRVILKELSQFYFENEIENKIFLIVDKELLFKVEIVEIQINETIKIKRDFADIPFGDILNAILARDNNAILVSRDSHFERLSNVVEFKKPEEII